ncbi:MAG: diguanylate cyclase, partial [Oceanospirillaceae bacterium]
MSKLSNYQTIKSLTITNQFAADTFLLTTSEEVWVSLTNTIIQVLGFDKAVIYTLDIGGKVLNRIDALSSEEPVVVSPIIHLIIGKVDATRKALLINDTREYDDYIENGEGLLSELAVPIVFQEQLLAVVHSRHANAGFYTEYHLKTLTELASISAMKISQICKVDVLNETIENLEYSNKIQDALFDISEVTFKTKSTSEFYRHLHQCVYRLTFTKNFFVALLTHNGTKIEFPYAVDEFDQTMLDDLDQGAIFKSLEVDPDNLSITGYTLLKNEPVLLYEKDLHRMLSAKELHVVGSIPKAWLGAPFGAGDKKGIVVVQSYSPDFLFQEKDKQLLSFVAKHINSAIERMDAKQELLFSALYDSLTSLPNRSLFRDKIENAFLHCQSDRSSNIAILFLDVDRFKEVNDTYGHYIGDELLIAIAKTIRGALRKTDTLARIGGDEFAILLDGNIVHDTILRVTKKIIAAMSEPFKINGLSITSSVSIGISTYNDGGDSAEKLLIDADHAMYQAKLSGRNQYVFFKALGSTHKSINVKLEYNFDNALKNQEFIGNYQPLIDFETGEVVGVEVLVRWQHPKLGLLYPDVFIPILEKSGQIIQLDIYMLKLAVRNLRLWSHWLPETFKFNVNVSTAGFASKVFIDYLQQEHQQSAEITDRLCIEITEESLILNVNAVKEHLAILKQINISVALDDFGTGYSSLNYL